MHQLIEAIAESWRVRRAASRPKPDPERRLARSKLQAALDARLAVRSGAELDDFLRHRLARYADRLPVPLESLPISLEIQGGEAVVRARPAPRTNEPGSGTTPAGEAWLRTLVEREGAGAVREIRDAEAALDVLAERAATVRERIDATARALAEDLASGALAPPVRVEATPEQIGRPPVPPALPGQLLRGFSLALLLAEAYRLAGPILVSAGVPGGPLPEAVQRAPLAAALGGAFAVGAAVAVFALLAVAVQRAVELVAETPAPRRRATQGGAALGAALLAAAVVAAAPAPGGWRGGVLLLVVPFTAVLLLRAAGRLAEARAEAERAALDWDRERTGEVVERSRRAEVLARAEGELRELEAERAEARRRLRVLEGRAIEAHRAAAEAARAESRRLDRLAEALAAALELDRYAYLRLASARRGVAHSAPARERPARLERPVPERLGVAG
jgi:hypothetical protein